MVNDRLLRRPADLGTVQARSLCDAVVMRGPDTDEIGGGLVAYDAEKIEGRSSANVMNILRISGRSERIHCDDFVVGGPRQNASA
jgi:glutamate 5-kinase